VDQLLDALQAGGIGNFALAELVLLVDERLDLFELRHGDLQAGYEVYWANRWCRGFTPRTYWRTMRASVAGRVGVGAGLATIACYAPGIGRPYGWDASNTVGSFVATSSLLDPFRRQVRFNNQVLFSAMEHVAY